MYHVLLVDQVQSVRTAQNGRFDEAAFSFLPFAVQVSLPLEILKETSFFVFGQ